MISLGDDDHKSSAKHVVVLGDDPKPKPPPPARRRRQANPTGRGGEGDQALYNHCKIYISLKQLVLSPILNFRRAESQNGGVTELRGGLVFRRERERVVAR